MYTSSPSLSDFPQCCGRIFSEGNEVWIENGHTTVSTIAPASGGLPRNSGEFQEEG